MLEDGDHYLSTVDVRRYPFLTDVENDARRRGLAMIKVRVRVRVRVSVAHRGGAALVDAGAHRAARVKEQAAGRAHEILEGGGDHGYGGRARGCARQHLRLG